MKKRFLCTLLAALMLLSLGSGVFAEELPEFLPEELPEADFTLEEIPFTDELSALPETLEGSEPLPELVEELPLLEVMEEATAFLAPDKDADQLIVDYIERCYEQILGRPGDQGGIDYWKNAMKSGAASAAEIVSIFCKSDEFKSMNLDYASAVNILYIVMLNRPADSGGIAYWTNLLSQGLSYDFIINGFAGSQEFGLICANYGIQPGSVELEPCEQNLSVAEFVKRCYRVALGREADRAGLNGWVAALLNHTMTAQEVSYAFLFSAEYEAKKTNNVAFIENLYQLYMNRPPDASGLSGWVSQLKSGMSRIRVSQGFANSGEFAGIVESYELPFVKEDTVRDREGTHYVLNVSTNVFHYHTCRDVTKMDDLNRYDYIGTRDEVVSMYFKSCGHCKP